MDIRDIIINITNESKKYDEKYNCLLSTILSNADTLVDISNGVYQIEHTIRANKISLKDYVLNSDICTILKDNNIHNYSINELRNYIARYNSNSTISYSLALDLYEQFEKLESIEKDKVEYEVSKLKKIIDFGSINKLSINELNDLYQRTLSSIANYSLEDNILIDIKKIINDVFGYYKSGSRIIYNSTDVQKF